MRIKKAPCLAWIRKSASPSNINLVVEVVSRAADLYGEPCWNVRTTTPAKAIDSSTGKPWPNMITEGICEDDCLTPINDPDLPVENVDTVAPKEVSKFDFDIKEKANV